MPPFRVKICGLSTPETLDAALDAGADMVAFNFHPHSPRFVSLERAAALAAHARGRAEIVALLVDPDDTLIGTLAEAIRPDWLQLHGSEAPERVRAVRTRSGLKVMKALGVAQAADLAMASGCAIAADLLLLDAKPPRDATYPGGHGAPFDWSLLAALDPEIPFMLSGGLRPETVGTAITAARAAGANIVGVDVSSGVEDRPGIKSIGLIADFVAAARAAASKEHA